MKKDPNEIIRSWKDTRFHETSSAALEPHPAGRVELDEALLAEVSGRMSTEALWTWGCCTFTTWNPLSPFDTNGYKTFGCCLKEE